MWSNTHAAVSITIQKEREHHLLNSRAEYNRCAVPRLTTKIGEKDYKKWERKNEEEREKEEILEEKIRTLRKNRNKERRNIEPSGQPAGKRRKTANGNFEETEKMRKVMEKRRKVVENEIDEPPKKRRRQMMIGEKIEKREKRGQKRKL